MRCFAPQTGKLLFQIMNAHSKVCERGVDVVFVYITTISNNHHSHESFLSFFKGVTAITYTNDAARLITGGAEGLVRVWKLGRDTQTLVTGLKEHKVMCVCVCVCVCV